MILTKDLKKQYNNQTVLDLPNLEIQKGECFGLVGNNGAGKTTFFSLVLDLIEPSNGMVLSDNISVKGSNHWQQYTGAYIDERFLIRHLTAEEYFDFVKRTYKLDNSAYHSFLDRFSDFFSDEVLNKNKYLRDFSKGNQKKVGIAASMMANPRVLILDEPFPHLDPTTVIRLKTFLQELKEDADITVLISSHDLSHVTEVCNRIAILEKGLIVHDKPTSTDTLNYLQTYFGNRVGKG